MTTLERVYLLNILIYLPSLESIKKFICINKKCKEVSEMVRIYSPKFRTDENYQYGIKNLIIPKNLLTLYPTIETIECTSKQLVRPQFQQLFEHVKIIRLTIDQACEINTIE